MGTRELSLKKRGGGERDREERRGESGVRGRGERGSSVTWGFACDVSSKRGN